MADQPSASGGKKILGMPHGVGLGVLILGGGVVAYIAYEHFFAGSSSGSASSSGAGAPASGGWGTVVEQVQGQPGPAGARGAAGARGPRGARGPAGRPARRPAHKPKRRRVNPGGPMKRKR